MLLRKRGDTRARGGGCVVGFCLKTPFVLLDLVVQAWLLEPRLELEPVPCQFTLSYFYATYHVLPVTVKWDIQRQAQGVAVTMK